MNDMRKYPEFSWSFTRHQTFLECCRRYAYSYYFSSGGWQKDAPGLNRHLYRLKTLQSIHMKFGSSIHNHIHRMISNLKNAVQLPSTEELMAGVRADLNKAYQDSKNQTRWFENPSQYDMLMEMYYENELPLEVIMEYQTKIPMTVKNLLASSTIHELIQRRNQIELIVAERFRYIELQGGIKVWVVMDLAYKDLERDKYVIVDFKTGKRSANDSEQLQLYARFIAETFNVIDLKQIELRNEYLADGSEKSYSPTPFDLEKVNYILASNKCNPTSRRTRTMCLLILNNSRRTYEPANIVVIERYVERFNRGKL